MDSTAVIQGQQGVVNQANSNSTKKAESTTKTNDKLNEAVVKAPDRVTAEFSKRVEEILSELKSRNAETSQPKREAAAQDDYIDVLRDVLLGKSSAQKVTFDAVAGPPPVSPELPVFPFDRSFLKVNLEHLRALASGDGFVDQQLAERIQAQLDALSEQQVPAQAQSPLDEVV